MHVALSVHHERCLAVLKVGSVIGTDRCMYMCVSAELKNTYSYVIALRHRTWAQAGAQKLPVLKVKNKVGSEKIRVWSSFKQRKIVFRKILGVYNF